MSNCIIAGFCSYVNRYRQYCCIIRKNGARLWLFAGKGRRRDAGIGELRRRLYIRLSQSLRRSHNRLGDPTIASAIAGGTRSARVRQTSQRRHVPNDITARQNCGLSKVPFCLYSCTKRVCPSFAKGGGSEAQSPRPPRRKTESARKRAQAGRHSRRLKEYGALCALLFARLLSDNLRLCRTAKPRHRFSTPPRASRAACRPARARPDSLCRHSAAKAAQFRPAGTRPYTVGFDSADTSSFFPPSFAEYKTDWKNRLSKKDVSRIY